MALLVQISPYISFDNAYAALSKVSVMAALFGHPVPPFVRLLLPQLLYLAILFCAALLVLRRIWLFTRTRSLSPPASFTRLPLVIYTVSIIAVLLFVVGMISAHFLNTGLRGIASAVVLPAVLLLPITVCWVEILSLRRTSPDAPPITQT